MPASIKQPFHFWRFFFSLKGRTTRLPFVAFFLPYKLIFLGASMLIDANIYGTLSLQSVAAAMYARNALNILNILLLWPVFSITFRRLHDIGLSGLLGLIWFAPAIVNAAVFALLMPATASNPFAMLPLILKSVCFYTLWAFTLTLALWPGTKGPNKYGPDPRQPIMDRSNVF